MEAIYYGRAFEIVSHNVLWSVMASMGYPTHIIEMIKQLYSQRKAAVRMFYGLTDCLTVEQGVCKEFFLSPDLFNFHSDQVIRNSSDNFVGSVKLVKLDGELYLV